MSVFFCLHFVENPMVSWHIVFVFRIVGLNPLPRVPRFGGLIWMLMVVGRKGRFQGADKKACIPAELAR